MSQISRLRVAVPEDIAALPALADALAAVDAPAISPYELGRLVFASSATKTAPALRQIYQNAIEALVQVRLLSAILAPTSSPVGYRLFGRKTATAAEIACSLDPFAYVSHLSAMEYHGLTDRFPRTLFMCRPPLKEWRTQAAQRMQKDLGRDFDAYQACGLPRLIRPALSMIDRTVIQFHERSQMGAFRRIAGSPLRVATVGRTFLDMLREPSLCAGMQHVLDVYRSQAKRYAGLIVDDIDRHGTPIDKVRAGYVLTEVCQLSLPIVDSWKSFAQRGGSRKLDPDAEYAADYSENWKLSLNVPLLRQRTDDSIDGE
jgi:predicted transcriptional regulator of viral defense system